MEDFTKNINGLDFVFTGNMSVDTSEWYYQVETENQAFEMHINENGTWCIDREVPVWLKDMEDEIGKIIDLHNE